jgi:ERCC4-related helicase
VASTTAVLGTTDYHAKFYANQLSRRITGDSPEKLATSLADSNVDLNPHQIDAALFAFQSPLSKGVILADEVGLGKTIEAGLVISQFWAERKRRILVITPANLRKQWGAELEDKFHLSSIILESGVYNRAKRYDPGSNPFDQDGMRVVICSLQFAASHEGDLERLPWDLVVIDEAHRLRNYSSRHAQRLRRSLNGRKKLLLTATPLQNNLLELWGLASLIDEHFFGERAAFQRRYGGHMDSYAFEDLRMRLRPLVQRTLRREAREFISYTERIAMLEEFTPSEEEQALYEMVSDYLRGDNLYALPISQRHLMTMVLRKLLASSTFAIAGALRTMANRLRRDLREAPSPALGEDLGDDYDALQETLEEWDSGEDLTVQIAPELKEKRAAIKRELHDLESFADLAETISHNAKVTALTTGLRNAFARMEKSGAKRKALIFTESRKTQHYLYKVLSAIPEFSDGLLLFDGSNADQASRDIYTDWKAKHGGTDRVTGSRAADIRAALVDYFRDAGQIMIATEAAAEGINLQFCSLVINYDLPWNPQRIEQRIGRCHRYGQEHDVVVLNFLNKDNEADQRVYELLDQKFHLFSGVFGASDEVLGTLENGVDIEKRIAAIYQHARTRSEIAASFQQMQLDLTEQISQQRAITERKLFEHFDEDVAERFRTRKRGVDKSLDRVERTLMEITRHELREVARFVSERSFVLDKNPYPNPRIATGKYYLLEREKKNGSDLPGHVYRPGHPLGLCVVADAKDRECPVAHVEFDYGAYSGRLSAIEPFLGLTGWLTVNRLEIMMDAGAEDHLLLAGSADDGRSLDVQQIETLFRVPGSVVRSLQLEYETSATLDEGVMRRKTETMETMEERVNVWIEQEQAKLDAWAEDRRTNLVGDIDKLDKQISALRRDLRMNPGDLRSKQQRRQEIAQLTKQRDDLEDRNRERRREIEREQETLLDRAYERIHQSSTLTELFTIRWSLTK